MKVIVCDYSFFYTGITSYWNIETLWNEWNIFYLKYRYFCELGQRSCISDLVFSSAVRHFFSYELQRNAILTHVDTFIHLKHLVIPGAKRKHVCLCKLQGNSTSFWHMQSPFIFNCHLSSAVCNIPGGMFRS